MSQFECSFCGHDRTLHNRGFCSVLIPTGGQRWTACNCDLRTVEEVLVDEVDERRARTVAVALECRKVAIDLIEYAQTALPEAAELVTRMAASFADLGVSLLELCKVQSTKAR